MAKKIPRFISQQYRNGARGFRVQHRQALRTAAKALELAMSGCAYAPSYEHLRIARKEIDDAIEATRPANWERAEGKTESVK